MICLSATQSAKRSHASLKLDALQQINNVTRTYIHLCPEIVSTFYVLIIIPDLRCFSGHNRLVYRVVLVAVRVYQLPILLGTSICQGTIVPKYSERLDILFMYKRSSYFGPHGIDIVCNLRIRAFFIFVISLCSARLNTAYLTRYQKTKNMMHSTHHHRGWRDLDCLD